MRAVTEGRSIRSHVECFHKCFSIWRQKHCWFEPSRRCRVGRHVTNFASIDHLNKSNIFRSIDLTRWSEAKFAKIMQISNFNLTPFVCSMSNTFTCSIDFFLSFNDTQDETFFRLSSFGLLALDKHELSGSPLSSFAFPDVLLSEFGQNLFILPV